MVETTSQSKQYDYIVVGAGVGGLATAKQAAKHGAKVVIIENKVIGGASVNWGSIPKKIMWQLANFMEDAKVMKEYGVGQTDGLKVDFPKFKAWMD